MTIYRNRHTSNLDGEMLFKKYCELGKSGSCGKLVEFLKSDGQRNPETGRPFTKMGCWKIMWRWVLDNPVKARPMWASYVLDLGQFLSDDDWKETLNARAKYIYGKKKFNQYQVSTQTQVPT